MSVRNAFSLILGLAFVVLGTAFTVFPDLLDHTAVGFEQRGILHHVWHAVVWLGGYALLTGVFMRDPVVTAVGMGLCGVAVVWNLAAILSHAGADVLALDIALRVVVICAVLACLVDISREDR